jgi:predicted aspartyl protease
MGLTVLELEVANPARPDVVEKVQLLVDSGAIYAVVPAPVLEALGIRPLAKQQFRLLNGARIDRRRGWALFRYGSRTAVADVLFGQPRDTGLVGSLTLQALGFVLDPFRRELRELPTTSEGV